MASPIQTQIWALIQTNAWDKLALLCEDYELEVAGSKHTPYYAIQLFAYLIDDNLNSARHLWRRIPNSTKTAHFEMSQVWAVGKQLIIGDHAAVFAALSVSWSDMLALLSQKFIEVYRRRTLALLSKSYSNITSVTMANYLGLSDPEAVAYATKNGWVVDAATNLLEPSKVVQEEAKEVGTTNLASLASYVVHLEQV